MKATLRPSGAIKPKIMKKLELKHLAPYLPYELKCHIQGETMHGQPILFEVESLNNQGADCHEVDGVYILETYFEDIFPVLRPLSGLTKDIEYKGEVVRAIDYISISKANSQRIMRRVANQQNLDCLEYWQFERLLSLHFDVFGLIEKGLAVDINALHNEEEDNEFDSIRCITFDKEAQDNLPEHIKAKMKADRDKARAQMVFSLPECVFQYCPHPNECTIGGCLSKKTT